MTAYASKLVFWLKAEGSLGHNKEPGKKKNKLTIMKPKKHHLI